MPEPCDPGRAGVLRCHEPHSLRGLAGMQLVDFSPSRPAEVFPAWSPAQRIAERRAMDPLPSVAALRAAAADPPHPLLSDASVDWLRTVHDVLGHAALGLGFDLQSEYAAWLYCRRLFSPVARPAAFCELVGAVTAYVITGSKPVLRADLPPAGL